MKILNKGTDESIAKCNSANHNKFIENAIRIIGSIIGIVGFFILVWPNISNMADSAVKNYNYNRSGWTTKIVSKTYPVSHIRIINESDYYDDNQKNAGYALVNYKALLDKGDMIALNVIKTNALEGNSDRYSYQFQVDEINYKSTEITEGDDADDELLHLFGSPNTNKFSEIKYKKGLKEPEVTVYYKVKYQHGKLKSKELKRDATLILPE